ncbi:branched-chain amino acid transport system 2 carrier protein [Candidatus Photodesmus blepharus]|uniref:Branched-chain amino acid transport system carrier protein n=2 Tax=Candidatus Photodesmus blepharonis TaxID=1179155 RepID=A0A084CMJ3_9GAMM|nr:branched-chain amino acid transport system 2 carrier protein [Candidatus Photodesmus blepharus]
MLFAFFLGAGNIIFPPLAGQLAGDNLLTAIIGFLLTAVGLPLITIVAIAISGGSWEHLTKDLPKYVATLIAILIFIIIGPAFAAPRTALVAYEMAVKPFFINTMQLDLVIFSAVFFTIIIFFAWSRGGLINIIGKILTPILFICLVILAIAVFIDPQGKIISAHGEYITHPLQKGFLEGYNTMDIFGSLMFGVLIVDTLRSKGITESSIISKYLIRSACIAAIGLTFVYISLFYLGATSTSVASNADNGALILSLYVQSLFGAHGQIVLSLIVLLACLTTAIGLISACSEYFSSLTPFSYKHWVVINSVICATVANIGLSQLIIVSIPVLFTLYPVAITLVTLAFIRKKLPNTKMAYCVVIFIALLFACLDALKVVGIDVSVFNILPLFEVGMSWLIPTITAIIAMFFVDENHSRHESVKETSKKKLDRWLEF